MYREMIVAPVLRDLDPLATVARIKGPFGDSALDQSCYRSLMDISITIKALYAHSLPGRAYEQCVADADLKISEIADDRLRAVLVLLDAAKSMEEYSSRWNYDQAEDSTLVEIASSIEAASAPLDGYLAAGLLRGNLELIRFAAAAGPQYFYPSAAAASNRVAVLDSALVLWRRSMLSVLIEQGCTVEAQISSSEFLDEDRYAAWIAVWPGTFVPLKSECMQFTSVVLAWINNQLEAFNWRFLPLPAARRDVFDAVNLYLAGALPCTHVEHATILAESARRLLKRVQRTNAGPEIETRVRVTLAETQCTLDRLAECGFVAHEARSSEDPDDRPVIELAAALVKLPAHIRSAHMNYLCDSRFLHPMWGGLPREERWRALSRATDAAKSGR